MTPEQQALADAVAAELNLAPAQAYDGQVGFRPCSGALAGFAPQPAPPVPGNPLPWHLAIWPCGPATRV